MLAELKVGPQNNADGVQNPQRGGKQGETICSELHGRFYEQCYRGNLYTFGLSNTALVAANAIATGVGATAQPVLGLYNPISSGVNLVILQAHLVVSTIANSAVAPGGFMWVASANNPAITTGSTPINCKTLLATGSQAKAFAVSTAVTGLTNNLSVLRASNIAPFNAAGAATAVSVTQGNSIENIDGGIIVPPGGCVGLMNQLSTTTCSVSVGIMWEEVPV